MRKGFIARIAEVNKELLLILSIVASAGLINFLVAGQRTDVLVVTSAQMVTADMVPDAPGIWLYHCHISDHMLAGMDARYEVNPR